jgi:NAD(P)-dependent dehydrogenase (short-subunit alcohol dehydrogenase family)
VLRSYLHFCAAPRPRTAEPAEDQEAQCPRQFASERPRIAAGPRPNPEVGPFTIGARRSAARAGATRVRPGGSLTFVTGTDARRPGVGSSVAAILAASLPTIAANIALELAPIRANVVAAGYVDTPLSARILGDDLERRRAELRATLPIRRVVGPDDLADVIVHLMTNSAVTGATYDIDGGQQLVP